MTAEHTPQVQRVLTTLGLTEHAQQHDYPHNIDLAQQWRQAPAFITLGGLHRLTLTGDSTKERVWMRRGEQASEVHPGEGLHVYADRGAWMAALPTAEQTAVFCLEPMVVSEQGTFRNQLASKAGWVVVLASRELLENMGLATLEQITRDMARRTIFDPRTYVPNL